MIDPPPTGWRRTLAAMQLDPTEYLNDALAAAGTRPDLLQAVHERLARLQAQVRDELLLVLVFEDDRSGRLALVQASNRRALVTHAELAAWLAEVNAAGPSRPS
jgi:hypothetical protein